MATHYIQNFIDQLLTEQDRYDSLANATPEQRNRLRDQDRRAAERAADPGYARTSGILRGGGSLEDALRDLESRGVQQRVTGALDPGSKGEGDYFGGNEMPRSSNELPRVAPRAGSQDGSFAREITQSNIPQGGQSGRWGGDAEPESDAAPRSRPIPAGPTPRIPPRHIPELTPERQPQPVSPPVDGGNINRNTGTVVGQMGGQGNVLSGGIRTGDITTTGTVSCWWKCWYTTGTVS